MKIRTVLQIIFCILASLAVVAASVLGILYGFFYFLVGAALALVFVMLMLLMKYGNPLRREKEEPHTDFMNSDKENEEIRKALENAELEENPEK